jgi:hypothetical protein
MRREAAVGTVGIVPNDLPVQPIKLRSNEKRSVPGGDLNDSDDDPVLREPYGSTHRFVG